MSGWTSSLHLAAIKDNPSLLVKVKVPRPRPRLWTTISSLNPPPLYPNTILVENLGAKKELRGRIWLSVLLEVGLGLGC